MALDIVNMSKNRYSDVIPGVPWIQGFKPHLKSANSDTNSLMVSQLIDQVSFMWNVSLIKDLFEPDSANAILSIHLPPNPRPDKLIWTLNPNGKFSVKSAFHIVTQPPSPPPHLDVNWKKLWKLKGAEWTKMFLWRLGTNTIPTKENLL